MIVYILIAICNACVWSALALLLGASTGRTLFAWVLVFLLSLAMMVFMAGCARCNERLDHDYRSRFVQ